MESRATISQEIANSVSHGLGLVAALTVTPFLVANATLRGSTGAVVGAGVFSATMVLLYLTSTLYHALPSPDVKRVLRTLDHAAIFLLIAGTYTPFTLGVLRGAWGVALLSSVWVLAVAGVLLKILGELRFERLSLALYVAMGWLVLVAIRPVWLAMPGWGVFWLVAGGVAYTAGIGFYLARSWKHHHLVWHLFVMAGTACHVVAVARYAG